MVKQEWTGVRDKVGYKMDRAGYKMDRAGYKMDKAGYKMDKEWTGGQVLPASVKMKLQRAGMSQTGIRQLALGQPISNKKDQTIVADIVVAALR